MATDVLLSHEDAIGGIETGKRLGFPLAATLLLHHLQLQSKVACVPTHQITPLYCYATKPQVLHVFISRIQTLAEF